MHQELIKRVRNFLIIVVFSFRIAFLIYFNTLLKLLQKPVDISTTCHFTTSIL